MQPADRDSAYLWDMLQACREVLEFTKGVKQKDFETDRMRCLAVERALEIVGEAARKVSEEFQGRHLSIPWRKIRGMRNILAHEYGEIDYEIIYKTARDEIPGLAAALEALLKQSP